MTHNYVWEFSAQYLPVQLACRRNA